MATKILRTAAAPNVAPTEVETQVGQALIDLESIGELKADLRALNFSAAKEVDVKGGRKAIVIFVPMPQLKAFHRIQSRCVSRRSPTVQRDQRGRIARRQKDGESRRRGHTWRT